MTFLCPFHLEFLIGVSPSDRPVEDQQTVLLVKEIYTEKVVALPTT